MVGTLLLSASASVRFSSLAMVLLYLAVLCSGAQSIIVDRDTRRSNSSNQYKEVEQQCITEY